MPSHWAERLGRLLPEDTGRDLFQPALADLRYEQAAAVAARPLGRRACAGASGSVPAPCGCSLTACA